MGISGTMCTRAVSFSVCSITLCISRFWAFAASGEVIVVPSALWMGKAPAAVSDAMKEDFDECVTAYVLLNWCKVGKTQVGRLLSPKEFGDDKSYRNHVDKLMLRAARLSIRQE